MSKLTAEDARWRAARRAAARTRFIELKPAAVHELGGHLDRLERRLHPVRINGTHGVGAHKQLRIFLVRNDHCRLNNRSIYFQNSA